MSLASVCFLLRLFTWFKRQSFLLIHMHYLLFMVAMIF